MRLEKEIDKSPILWDFNSNINVIDRLVARLRTKKEEYQKRLERKDSAQPNSPKIIRLDFYKLFLVDKLLTQGKVDFDEAEAELLKKFHYFDPTNFRDAYLVIKDYTESGGNKVIGGTGF